MRLRPMRFDLYLGQSVFTTVLLTWAILLGLDLVKDRGSRSPDPDLAQEVARNCLELGMMTSTVRGGFGIFRIAPPLTVAEAEIELGLEIFDRALTKALH